MQSKTFNEFWQLFLQVTFHEGKPERWTIREMKAKWCQEHLKLNGGAKIVDLGCGDGILDIWLSRMGFDVTAIDRGGSVLDHARSEDDTKKVKFLEHDLQNIHFPSESLNAVIILETLGLMHKEGDLELLKKTFHWLKPGGSIAVDCPIQPSLKNDWSKEFTTGTVKAFTSFDENSRVHQLNFEFYPEDGDPFILYDPSPGCNSGPGITRYIYPQDELRNMLFAAGYKVKSVPHYCKEGYYSLLGLK